jgi:hypothetical protein
MRLAYYLPAICHIVGQAIFADELNTLKSKIVYLLHAISDCPLISIRGDINTFLVKNTPIPVIGNPAGGFTENVFMLGQRMLLILLRTFYEQVEMVLISGDTA